MGHVGDHTRCGNPHQGQSTRSQSRELDNRHRRNRRKIKQQPGHTHTRKHSGRHGHDQNFCGHGCQDGCAQPIPDARPPDGRTVISSLAPTRRAQQLRQHHDEPECRAKRQPRPHIDHRERVHQDAHHRHHGEQVHGPRVESHQTQQQVDHGGHHRTSDRRLPSHHHPVEDHDDDGCHDGKYLRPGDQPQHHKTHHRQHRHIAAGDGDHVKRPGCLQPPRHLIVEPRPITDQNGVNDRGGVLGEIRCSRAPHVRTHGGAPLLPPWSRRNLHQCGTFDGANQIERTGQPLPRLTG